MFSLSYLPTAERLTVVVVKGRNLKLDQDGREAIDLQNIFVKVGEISFTTLVDTNQLFARM